jgi:site-specific recombinase XerD
MKNSIVSSLSARRLKSDLTSIDKEYVEYLQKRHTSFNTIRLYRGVLRKLAHALCRQGRNLSALRRQDVAGMVRRRWKGYGAATRGVPQAALHAWLRLHGRFHRPPERTPWRALLEDYARFMEVDRGLAPCTRSHRVDIAEHYLAWQFHSGAVRWSRVSYQDIWRYSAQLNAAGKKPKTVSGDLSDFRQFLRFLHLRGHCPLSLPQAVPAFADRGRSLIRQVLTDGQRSKLLASFDRQTPEGRRDYTMALCMSDLGLRAIEVVRLRLCDLDSEAKVMAVPPAKASRGRQLPLPPHLAAALRIYVRKRPATISDRLFVGHAKLIGRPLTSTAVSSAMNRAYLRSGLDCSGSHCLRRSFATRLYAHGANMKEIADLLGHRLVITTERYAQVDQRRLHVLVQPWPT